MARVRGADLTVAIGVAVRIPDRARSDRQANEGCKNDLGIADTDDVRVVNTATSTVVQTFPLPGADERYQRRNFVCDAGYFLSPTHLPAPR